MEFTYGKHIDPKKFKMNKLSNLKKSVQTWKSIAKNSLTSNRYYLKKCYICGSRKFSRSILNMYGYTYVRCLNCSHIHLKNMFSQKQTEQFYERSSQYASTYTDIRQIKYRKENIAKPKVDWVLQNIPQHKGGLWLDIGCGIGDVSACVMEHVLWKSIGIDINMNCITTGKKIFGVDIRHDTPESFFKKNKDIKFDVISFFGFLDAQVDPKKHLVMAYRHLKKNGRIVIWFPHHNSLSTLVQTDFPHMAIRHLQPPSAKQQFTLHSAKIFLAKTHFKPLSFWFFGLDFYEFLNHLILKIKGFDKTKTYKFFMAHLFDFQIVVDNLQLSDGFMVLAKKI